MVVSKLIFDEQEFLKKLSKSKSRKNFHKLISNANSRQLLSIVEIIFNILKSKVYLSKLQKQQLQSHADILRKIAKIRSEEKARKFLLQTGGNLPLLALLAPILIEIGQKLVEKIL